ncbi:hypothetical protein K2X85_17310 [bacterium]|nr:hypothetical protein [bacterium]
MTVARSLLYLSFIYAALAGVVLAALAMNPTVPIGMGILVAVVYFNVIFPLAAIWGQHHEWLRLWVFLLPLSLMMILPDWFLSAQLDVLVFPSTGSPYIGTVPIFMAGMWTIPLVLVVWLADHAKSWGSYLVAGIVSAVMFWGSEAIAWRIPIWHAQNVRQIEHVALYLLVPEVILGMTTLAAYRWSGRRGLMTRLMAAYLVMMIYLGQVAGFYFIVERIGSLDVLWRLPAFGVSLTTGGLTTLG